jgi:hypothetical protein
MDFSSKVLCDRCHVCLNTLSQRAIGNFVVETIVDLCPVCQVSGLKTVALIAYVSNDHLDTALVALWGGILQVMVQHVSSSVYPHYGAAKEDSLERFVCDQTAIRSPTAMPLQSDPCRCGIKVLFFRRFLQVCDIHT